MSIQSAIDLLKQVDTNVDLRLEMYACKTPADTQSCLNKNGFLFNINELEEAINSLHVKCQTIYEAQDLLHKAEWLKFILVTT